MLLLHDESLALESSEARLQAFTRDPILQASALRALQRIETAIGEPDLEVAGPERAADCVPFRDGCGFEISFEPTVLCFGNPDPALACTSLAARGKTSSVTLQAELRGEELDNRLIHELFHVITRNHADHSTDGLFMTYTVGDERITAGTLEAVCASFSCSKFEIEVE